jgi:hypothetical protein
MTEVIKRKNFGNTRNYKQRQQEAMDPIEIAGDYATVRVSLYFTLRFVDKLLITLGFLCAFLRKIQKIFHNLAIIWKFHQHCQKLDVNSLKPRQKSEKLNRSIDVF